MLRPFTRLISEMAELLEAIRSPLLLQRATHPKDNRPWCLGLAKRSGCWHPDVGASCNPALPRAGDSPGSRFPVSSRKAAPGASCRGDTAHPTLVTACRSNVRNAWEIAQSTEQPVGNSLSQYNLGANEKLNN